MCGIVGTVGNSCQARIIQGLERLEYRGYDSSGFACIQEGSLVFEKATGYLENLKKKLLFSKLEGSIAIGHTRWATHGAITQENAHPHIDCTHSVAVVHNGIIENFHILKEKLINDGHTFVSDTDTEVIAHLVEHYAHLHDLVHIACAVAAQLRGAYACLILHKKWPNQLMAIRKSSPLSVGFGSYMYVASDALAFAGLARTVSYMPDETIGIVTTDTATFYDFTGLPRAVVQLPFDLTWSDDGKCGYPHFMLKEIYEQKNAIQATMQWYTQRSDTLWPEMGVSMQEIKKLHSLYLIGCGTSWHAGRIAQFFFESIARIPTRVVLASEFRYNSFFPEKDNIYIGISQSGETIDTLECIRLINSFGLPTVGLTNVASSTLAHEARGILLTKAGREISVASTKAFSTQLATLFWLANRIAFEKGLITYSDLQHAYADILIAAEILEESIERYSVTISHTVAQLHAQFNRFIFLGRHITYPFALEAALKLKEISYIFSQAYPAGELKHGPIALLDGNTPVVLFSVLSDEIYRKIVSNAQQVKSRGAYLIIFAFEGQDELIALADCVFLLPKLNPLLVPFAMTGLMQFWVYHIANVLKHPIDKPRNLAKSVTVE